MRLYLLLLTSSRWMLSTHIVGRKMSREETGKGEEGEEEEGEGRRKRIFFISWIVCCC